MNASKNIDSGRLLVYFVTLYEIPWILRWDDKIFKTTDLGLPQLGKVFFGQWWKKFNDSHLSKRNIDIVLIGQKINTTSFKGPFGSVDKLISSLEKENKKLQPKEKEKLKQLLEEDSDEDTEMASDSDNDFDYSPCQAGYSQDPNDI